MGAKTYMLPVLMELTVHGAYSSAGKSEDSKQLQVRLVL